MLLKKYSFIDGKFCSTNPLSAEGYVRIKKEQSKYSVVIQINNFISPSKVYIVCDNIFKQSKITSGTTKIELDASINVDKTCVLLPNLNLFAVKSSTNICEQAITKINAISSKPSGNILDKVFGKVYDTYFFDCIKPKLASLFALGSSVPELSNIYPQSKWTMVSSSGCSKVVGVIYKDNFAYAIGVGDEQTQDVIKMLNSDNILNKKPSITGLTEKVTNGQYITDSQNNKNLVTICGKNFNLLFLSAKNGKFMQI